jgi:hypothetical protein
MLQERDSAEKHQEVSWRFIRQCNRLAGGAELTGPVSSCTEDLRRKTDVLARAVMERQGSLDDIIFADRILDRKVKTLFASASQYDCEHPGAQVLNLLFPSGKFTDITEENRNTEPETVDKVAHLLESLGADHPLASHAKALREQAQQVRDFISSFNDRIRAQKSAEADVEISAAQLRRTYETSYLDARKLFGRDLAEALFPHTSGSSPEKAPAASATDK